MSLPKKDFIGLTIGIDLLNGMRVIGKVHNWGEDTIWVLTDKFNKPIDVPRDLIQRALVCIEGGKSKAV